MGAGFLQGRLKEYSEQEQSLTQEVEKAQAEQDTAVRQQQEQQRRRVAAQAEEAQIQAQLYAVQANLAQLQDDAQHVPALSDVSYSEDEEEDPEISSSDESDSDTGSPQPAGHQVEHSVGGAANPNGSLAGVNGVASLADSLQRLQPTNGAPPKLPHNLMYMLHREQQIKVVDQVDFAMQENVTNDMLILVSHVQTVCQAPELQHVDTIQTRASTPASQCLCAVVLLLTCSRVPMPSCLLPVTYMRSLPCDTPCLLIVALSILALMSAYHFASTVLVFPMT